MKQILFATLLSAFALCSCSNKATQNTGNNTDSTTVGMEDTSKASIRLKEIRRVYSEKGPLNLPIVLEPEDSLFEQKIWQDSLITRDLFGDDIHSYMIGILPDTSDHFSVIVALPLDIWYPKLVTIDKKGNKIQDYHLFDWYTGTGGDIEANIDSAIEYRDYTTLYADMNFTETVDVKSLEHVWEGGGSILLGNSIEDALKDTANLWVLKSVVKSRINNDGTTTVDLSKENIYDKKHVIDDTIIGLHFDWEHPTPLNLKELLKKKK